MFRYTIRDLARLTLLAAISLAWWVDRSRLDSERHHWRWEFIYLMHETGHVSLPAEEWEQGPRAQAHPMSSSTN